MAQTLMGLVQGLGWFMVIALMFFAQHHVCDAYFVPAINVFVKKMKKRGSKWGEEAVAGATICALGCNGPELFSNLLSLYTGSDAGIGVVVGSEVFNLLVIIGCSVLFAPRTPLDLEKAPFTRDCIFYFISIVGLYKTLEDKAVQWNEALGLLAAAAVYVTTVFFTSDLVALCGGKSDGSSSVAVEDSSDTLESRSATSDKHKSGRICGIEVDIEQIVHGMKGAMPEHQEHCNIEIKDRGMLVEPPKTNRKNQRKQGSIGFQVAKGGALLDPIMKYDNLNEVTFFEGTDIIQLEFLEGFKHITLKFTCGGEDNAKILRDKIQEKCTEKQFKVQFHAYDATIKGAISHFMHELKNGSCCQKILAVPEFIIDLLLKATLFWCDVKDVRLEDRWALCFLGAMTWLAFFSYMMLEVANQINACIPALTTAFLGITVCAVGTSFPNAVASVIMAQQDKPAAAIANALGSNVQNVFLAMALPWVIFMSTKKISEIPQNVAGINEGVYWMMGTLILVLIFALMPKSFQLNTFQGYILIAVYLVYVVLTSGEAFHYWNPLVN